MPYPAEPQLRRSQLAMRVVWEILAALAMLAGIVMVVGSIADENVYWLIFGIAVAFGAERQMDRLS
jgi:hypothetical protein